MFHTKNAMLSSEPISTRGSAMPGASSPLAFALLIIELPTIAGMFTTTPISQSMRKAPTRLPQWE